MYMPLQEKTISNMTQQECIKNRNLSNCLKAPATKIWISTLSINILSDKIRKIIFSKCNCCISIIIETYGD